MYIGIDVGGTNLKAGLVSESGELLAVERMPLDFQGAEAFAAQLAALAETVMAAGGAKREDVSYVGVGIPGAVRGGEILYTANIPMRNVPLETLFRRHLDLPVLLGNDADCAAVGEWLFGAGRGTRHFIVITLGTGVGGGLILNGKLYCGCGAGGADCAAVGEWLFGAGRGTRHFIVITLGTGVGGGLILNGKLYCGCGAGGEVGHIVIDRDGPACNCGRRGCWETYASATGLIRQTREAMAAHPESLLHAVAARNGAVDGRTPFQAAQEGDETALAVCQAYARSLAAGLTDLVNILHPEAVALGGGVAAAPEELLLRPVEKLVAGESYARHVGQVLAVCQAYARSLAAGLTDLVNILHPEAVALGGGVAAAPEELLLRPVEKLVAGESYARHVGQVPRIVRAELGNDAGILGAAMLRRAL